MIDCGFRLSFKRPLGELKLGTPWPATQLPPRGVKAGLGGHDAGASQGQKTHRSRYGNGDDLPGLNDPPSVRMMQQEWNSSMDNEIVFVIQFEI